MGPGGVPVARGPLGGAGMSCPTKAAWRRTEKGRAENRERMRRRRALLKGAAAQRRREVDAAGMATCAACGCDTPACEVDVDHIVPLSWGGADVAENLQDLCRDCHGRKTAAELRSPHLRVTASV